VHSVAVLLRSNAKAANLTGDFAYAPQPSGEVRFRFEVVRVWERSMDDLFAGGPGLMPLAVLGKPPKGQSRAKAIPGTLVSIAEEATRSAPLDRATRIVAAALLLAGMHIETDTIRDVIRRFPVVIESSAYEAFEQIVGVKRFRELIQLMGREKFGAPTPAQEKKLAAIEDYERLKRLGVRLIKVDTWDDLLKGK
jgi:hypothetical protein